ncbi:PP2C family protein-serine/threonine phosphatase [Streptomyces sp. NPDC048650]|uniref:PP2C family protein-serine/threonine phosphatase n=1 Tax=unclassified Streptomyces TaxID=2593676 RepID=UPI003713F2D3
MIPHTFHTLPAVRSAVRRISSTHQLPAETRARLALSVSALAAPVLRAGHHVTLRTALTPGTTDHELLTVTIRPARPDQRLQLDGLPLTAHALADGAAAWHIPVTAERPSVLSGPLPPAEAPGEEADATATGGPEAEIKELEAELAAALKSVDSLTSQLQRLQSELNETNSGVLALYVQLEERDEQLRLAHGQMLRELEDALRPSPPVIDGLELAVHYAPAGTDAPTGGDHYDWFRLPDGSVHITVVDALGHGIRSTGSALNVTHAVRTLALEGHPLASIVARTDEILAPFDPELMATLALVRIDPGTGEMQLANGSHPPPLLLRGDGSHEYLTVRGRGVGYPLPGSDAVLRRRLAEDDLLLLYTDGLTESRRDPIEGEKRLVRSAKAHTQHRIEDIPGRIGRDMHTLILHADDTLALAVRRTCAR